jgi:urease accessory protein
MKLLSSGDDYMRRTGLALGLAGAALMALPAAALAHTGHMEPSGFMHGFEHPLGGLDHLLVMVAVGLWAAQSGGRALLALPAAFVGAMILGALAGMAGLPLPAVELGILGSVLALGALVAFQPKLSVSVCVAITAAFAVFHGYAHGVEMPVAASPWTYGLGFATATALLHAGGIGLIVAVRRFVQGNAGQATVRGSGALVAVGGVALALLG